MVELNDTLVAGLLNATTQNSDFLNSTLQLNIIATAVSVMMSAMIYFILFHPMIKAFVDVRFRTKRLMQAYSEKSGRGVIVMNHAQTGIFGSMITMTDVLKIESMIRKFKGKPLDLIINTFGGDLFASIRLATMLRQNPQIRVVVPKYAWSGGSLISIGANRILVNKNSIFGPVDPQFGSILEAFSAKYWEEILRKKGKDSKDETIAKARMAKEIMREMESYCESLIGKRKIDKKRFYDLFLKGKHTHGRIITPEEMKMMGFDVEYLQDDSADRIVEGFRDTSGVFGYFGKGS